MFSRTLVRSLVSCAIVIGAQPCEAYVRYLQFPLAGCREYRVGKGQVMFSESFGDADRNDGATLIIEVDNVPLPPGTELVVVVQEKEVGTFKLDRHRNGRFILESKSGKSVPRLAAGAMVTVRIPNGVKVLW